MEQFGSSSRGLISPVSVSKNRSRAEQKAQAGKRKECPQRVSGLGHPGMLCKQQSVESIGRPGMLCKQQSAESIGRPGMLCKQQSVESIGRPSMLCKQ